MLNKFLNKLLLKSLRPSVVYTSSNEEIEEFEKNEEKEDIEISLLEAEHSIDKLSITIQYLITESASLLIENNPYPTKVINTIDKLQPLSSSIQKLNGTSIFRFVLLNAKDNLFNDDSSFLSEKEILIRRRLFEEVENNGGLDLNNIQSQLLDRYFCNFKSSWESAINELQRKDAIKKRREYLINLAEEFICILSSKGINKYNSLLLDYVRFNKNILGK